MIHTRQDLEIELDVILNKLDMLSNTQIPERYITTKLCRVGCPNCIMKWYSTSIGDCCITRFNDKIREDNLDELCIVAEEIIRRMSLALQSEYIERLGLRDG